MTSLTLRGKPLPLEGLCHCSCRPQLLPFCKPDRDCTSCACPASHFTTCYDAHSCFPVCHSVPPISAYLPPANHIDRRLYLSFLSITTQVLIDIPRRFLGSSSPVSHPYALAGASFVTDFNQDGCNLCTFFFVMHMILQADQLA